ncbi:MAG: hypothetical protein K8T25_03090 [Planctomycetia bacterium]|nr:hypothetical protein [Planctomycetia bacterium]
MIDSPFKPKRRWFQFRLRTLLAATTIIAIWLGWWSYKARQQRDAVAALRLIGARVEYDTTLPWTGGMKAPPKWPEWAMDRVGVDYFSRVDVTTLNGTMYVSGKRVTDAGVEHIKNLTALRYLDLQNSGVTDAGLEHLKELRSLQTLYLDNTTVTDAGLESLKNLTALENLGVGDTQVTDAGVARLQKSLPHCKIRRFSYAMPYPFSGRFPPRLIVWRYCFVADCQALSSSGRDAM